MVTLGVVLAFTIPVLFLLLSITSIGYEDTARAQADASSRTLADNMNSVYAQGPGAEREILLNVPATTQNITVTSNEVVVTIKTTSGIYQAASPTIASINPLYSKINAKSGLFPLIIKTDSKGEVELNDTVSS